MKSVKRFKQSYLDSYMYSWQTSSIYVVYQHSKKKPILLWVISK